VVAFSAQRIAVAQRESTKHWPTNLPGLTAVVLVVLFEQRY
jgi:hypothetical protein